MLRAKADIFSTGTQSLPPPNSTLKALTLGRGTQNYTCDATTSTPVAVGAIASLLDVSPLLAFLPPAAGLDLLELIPRYLLDFDLPTITSGTIPILGHHYFNAAGQPTFDLGSTGFLTGKKVGDIPAPSNASIGQFDQGFGAVDWLALGDAGCSVILSEAYRVETAGGKAPSSCTGQAGNIEVQYAALYWFYQE